MRWKVGDGVGQRVKGPRFISKGFVGFYFVWAWVVLLDQVIWFYYLDKKGLD